MAGFKFVTVLGHSSSVSCWPFLRAELQQRKIFFSTNIEEIKVESIFKLQTEVLENVRHPSCLGIVTLISDQYFDYLDTRAAAEKEILLHHIQNKRNMFSILSDGNITERPEFNLIRARYNAQNPEALSLDFRAWLQDPAVDRTAPEDFHPDIHTILRVAFGSSVQDFSGSINPTEGVHYNLYRYDDPFMLSRNFVLYLHSNSVISRTAAHLKKNFENAIQSHPMLVIADPKAKFASRESWLRTITTNFECSNALFLDEFVQRRFSLTLSPSLPPARTILSPRSRAISSGQRIEDSFAYFNAYIERSMEELPVVVIRGQGGIGKTTFSRHLQRLVADKGGIELVVLSAPDVIRLLTDNPEVASNFTLFNLLRSMFPTPQMAAIGEQEFSWIFDTGRLSIVIDGIDEIIPRLPSSSCMHTLFSSIGRYSNYLRRGKIILTCRNSDLLTDFSGDTRLDEYDLLPFDSSQVSEFIEARFPSLRSLQKKALGFLEEIELSSENGILPFVVRIACDSVQNSVEDKLNQPSLHSSEVLSVKGKLDYVVYKVCEREEAKYEYSRFLGRNSVDIQCLFFVQLALVDGGQCLPTRLDQFFKQQNADMDKEILSRLYDHPLLSKGPHITFAYDVINDFFLTLGFHRGIMGAGPLEISNVVHVADRCQVNSPFLEQVAGRIDALSDDLILTISDYVSTWHGSLQAKGRIEEYYRCASAVFNSGLQVLCKRYPKDRVRATEYLLNVFSVAGDSKVLRGVTLHNIPENSAIRFDFSDLTFDRASIVNFEEFLRCKFNDATRFRNSRIKPGSSKRWETSATRENFVDTELEGSILDGISRMLEKKDYQIEDAKIQLRNFLRIFRLHNSFHHRRQIGTLSANYHSNTGLMFKTVQKVCEDENLIEVSGSEISIVKSQIDDVESFIHERIYRGAVEQAILKIFNLIR